MLVLCLAGTRAGWIWGGEALRIQGKAGKELCAQVRTPSGPRFRLPRYWLPPTRAHIISHLNRSVSTRDMTEVDLENQLKEEKALAMRHHLTLILILNMTLALTLPLLGRPLRWSTTRWCSNFMPSSTTQTPTNPSGIWCLIWLGEGTSLKLSRGRTASR